MLYQWWTLANSSPASSRQTSIPTQASIINLCQLRSPKWCLPQTKFQTHKAGDPSSLPANFRPFALTSCIGKVFHKIIAKHLERYLSPTTSLSHQFRKASLVKSMVQSNIHFTWVPYWKTPEPTVPIFATFLDLKNAFGFIPHALIVDMFHHIRLPLEVTSYICGQLFFQGPGCCVI